MLFLLQLAVLAGIFAPDPFRGTGWIEWTALILPFYALCADVQRLSSARSLREACRFLFAGVVVWQSGCLIFTCGRGGSLWDGFLGVLILSWPCLWLRFPRAPQLERRPRLGLLLSVSALLLLPRLGPLYLGLGVLVGMAAVAEFLWSGPVARGLRTGAVLFGTVPVAQSWLYPGCKTGAWVIDLALVAGLLWPVFLAASGVSAPMPAMSGARADSRHEGRSKRGVRVHAGHVRRPRGQSP